MSKPNPKRPAKSSSRRPTARDNAEKDESADRAARGSAALAASSGGGGGSASATRTPTDAEAKEEITTNGDKKDGKAPDDPAATPVAPKPQSASITIRDAGQKLLTLTMKQEWTSIDPVLKQLEKIVATTGEAYASPLMGLVDPVKICHLIWAKK